MTELTRQVRRAEERRHDKDIKTGVLHRRLNLPRIDVRYDPEPAFRLDRSKYAPHIGARERGRYAGAA